MRRLFFLLFLIMVFLPFTPARASLADLGFRNKGDLSFSTKTFVVGESVRVYAQVHNFGDVDVSGYVSFMQGMVEIGNTQVISVRAGGQEEEVYVDFVVPDGDFNIRAEIRATDPVDQNTSNDIILSPLETPIADEDSDGVEDDVDNCPSVSNSAQKDTDSDGAGDSCDSDDDNDTLSDSLEKEMGTNTLDDDSDGDGVADASDYAPTDSTVTTAPVVVPVAEPTPTPTSTSAVTTTSTANNVETNAVDPTSTDVQEDAREDSSVLVASNSNGAALSDLQISPNAIFTYEQTRWNTYRFTVQGFDGDDYRYQWDFGDGVSSNRAEIEHTYRAFGTYTVGLTVTDPSGKSATDATQITISFFHSQNVYLQLLLALLAVLCATSVMIYLKVARRKV